MATIVTRSGKGSPLTHAEVDANFTNLNTDKLELSGGTMTGNLSFGDNVKSVYGAGSDLQIYHDGSHSYVSDQGTGNLLIRGENVLLQKADGTENYFRAVPNAEVKIYYNGSEKLATTSTGIDVTGTVTADGLTVESGIGNTALLGVSTDSGTEVLLADQVGGVSFKNVNGDIELRVNGAASTAASTRLAQKIDGATGDISFYEDTGTTAKFFWDASAERLGLGTTSPSASLHIDNGSSTHMYLRGSSGDPYGLWVSPTGTDFTIGSWSNGSRIKLSDSSEYITFGTGSSTTERMRITSSGSVGIGTSSPDDKLHVYSTSSLDHIKIDGPAAINRNVQFSTAGSTRWNIYANSTAEAGSNAGSDLSIARYTDAGAYNGIAMFIERSSGNVGIGTSSPSFNSGTGLEISRSGTASLRVERTGATASSGEFFAGNGQVVVNSVSNTPLIFRTNNTDRMRIDSSGNVGVGTSSPSAKLDVVGEATVGNGTYGVKLSYSVGNTSGIVDTADSADKLEFRIANSEKMRIDSSGNLLVGKTAPNIGVAGAEIKPNGNFASTANGDWAALFNRLTSDGDIVQFRKDGTTVGSIEVADGDNLVIASTVTDHAGFKFSDTTVTPWVNNANSDNAMDIGAGANRFKDLYLSGGVYLGGTGAANKLDDYESGSVTLTMGGGTSNPSTTQSTTGQYIKVGSLVTVWFKFSNKDNSGASGTVEIDGLPFTVTSLLDGYGTAWGGRDSAGGTGHKVYLAGNGTTSAKMIDGSGNNVTWSSTGSGTYQGGMIIYRT